jgi:glycerate 2-kinase
VTSLNPVHDLENIYRAAVLEVDPAGLISSRVKKNGRTLSINSPDTTISVDLAGYKKIIILGIGKASARMASAMEDVLADEPASGFVVTKYGHSFDLRKTEVLEAGHPLPDENSIRGARIMAQMAGAADENTLLINLVSGGGSSLFCLPAEGISLEDTRGTTSVLLASGATIDEMNCIRKHLSQVKGGGLARIAWPARLINLILSDVIGDRIDTIASGITAPDPTTFNDALSIIRKYSLEEKLPQTVRYHLLRGAKGDIPETPKAASRVFDKTTNIILGNNTLAIGAAHAAAQRLGYHARILSTTLSGEASQAGADFAALACEIDSGRSKPAKPAVIIAGGETTVTIRGRGKGGRNQEMALAFAVELHRTSPEARNIYFLSAGTDGSDGPTDAAGAFVTPGLMERMREIAAKAAAQLAENDAYHFFEDTGCLFKTGPTYTNVCDIQILAVI